jgi:Ca2+-binding EF-hand superfamily protein
LDWSGLFTLYDKNHDNLLDKNELKTLVKDTKFKEVTDAEVSFIFNVVSMFQKFLKKSTFLEWV